MADFKDEDGNWDLERIASDLFAYGSQNGFTTTEWYAMMQLFSEGLGLGEIVWVYELAILFSSDTDGMRAVLNQLSEDFVDRLIAQSQDRIWMMTGEDLERLLRVTGLLEFLGTLDPPYRYRGGSILHLMSFNFADRHHAHITFDDIRYHLSGLSSLLGYGFGEEQLRGRLVAEFDAAGDDLKHWFDDFFVDLVKYGMGFGPGIGPVIGSADAILGMAQNLSDILNQSGASEIQASYATWMLAQSLGMLGFSVAVSDTPDGLQIIVQEPTQASMINIAALGAHGYTEGDIMQILSDFNHDGQAFSDINSFLNNPQDGRLA